MVNYELAKIYKIIDNTNNNVFIGSTCHKLICKRIGQHKTDFRNFNNGKNLKYYLVYDILKNNDYKAYLVENYPCSNIEELQKHEREIIDSMDCINKKTSINTNIEDILL